MTLAPPPPLLLISYGDSVTHIDRVRLYDKTAREQSVYAIVLLNIIISDLQNTLFMTSRPSYLA